MLERRHVNTGKTRIAYGNSRLACECLFFNFFFNTRYLNFTEGTSSERYSLTFYCRQTTRARSCVEEALNVKNSPKSPVWYFTCSLQTVHSTSARLSSLKCQDII